MSPLAWLAFVAAGAVGAPVRHLVDGAVAARLAPEAERGFPWGTFAVNVSGSLMLGLVTGLVLHHGLPEAPRVVLGAGLCGAYTTFSTHTFETVRLLEDGAVADAARNVVGTLAAGLAGAAAGLALAAVP